MKLKRAIIFSDVHIPYQNEKCVNVVKNIIKENKFDEIILAGDIIDGGDLSSYINYEEYKVSLSEELIMLKDFINQLRALSPNSKIVLIGCNHFDKRLDRYIRENINIDCIREEITPEKLLKKFEIDIDKKVPYNKVYFPFTQRQIGIIHGTESSKYFTEKYIKFYTHSLIVGHAHTTQHYRAENGIEVYGIGCMCRTMAYLHGKPVRWNNSFAVLNYDYQSRKYFVEILEIKNGYTCFDGKIYKG